MTAQSDKESDQFVFHQDFRFTLTSKNHSEATDFVAKVNYSLTAKVLNISYYDVNVNDKNIIEKIITFDLKDDCKDEFTLVDYDGLGQSMGRIKFFGCKLIDHFVKYDYEGSSAVIHKLAYCFEEAKFTK